MLYRRCTRKLCLLEGVTLLSVFRKKFISNQEIEQKFLNTVECLDWSRVMESLERSESLLNDSVVGLDRHSFSMAPPLSKPAALIRKKELSEKQ